MPARLITLDQAKWQLSLTTPDGDPTDAFLQLLMESAEAHVLSVINANPVNRDVVATWVDPNTVPPEVRACILGQLAELDRYRGDDEQNVGPTRAPDGDLSPYLMALIRRWVTPVVG